MNTITLRNARYRSRSATAIYDLLNPIPFGMFVGTLIFDIIFTKTGNVFWAKGAAWLVSVGLIIAIIPRLINLGHVWFGGRAAATRIERMDFWLNLLAIVAAIMNAFVHSRDAYAMVPLNVILSLITVALISIGYVMLAFEKVGYAEVRRD